MDKTCDKCGKVFQKKPVESKEYWATRKYCSKSCANSITSRGRKQSGGFKQGYTPWNKGLIGKLNTRYTSVDLSCKTCTKVFIVRNYRKKTAKYCSKKCADNDNLGLTPIHERIRKSLAYEEWRKQVFERDLYTCQGCGEIGGYLQADHIKPFALYPDLRLDLNNGRTLCQECHRKTETYGIKLVRQMKQSKLGG